MKNIFKKYRKAKGFTLVELLIVIIIIGILAGMMMLASGAATDKAEAPKNVSDMRNIKAAVIMVYADNNAWPTADASSDLVNKYLDNSIVGSTAGKGYSVTSADGKVKVVLTFATAKTSSGVIDKLNDMTDVLSSDSATAEMAVTK